MSHANIPLKDALAQLIAECKQLDASEVGERWNQFNGAIAVSEMVLRDYVEPEPYGWLTGDSASHRQGTLYDLSSTYEFAKATCDETNRWERAQPDCDSNYVDRVPEPLYAAPVSAQPVAPHQPAAAELTPTEKLVIISEAQGATDEWAEGLSYEPSLTEVKAYMFDIIAAKLAAPVVAQPAAAPTTQSMVIGFPDPNAVFAAFCDREGYPSDGEMDGLLRKAFWEAVRMFSGDIPAAAPSIAAPTEVERDAVIEALHELALLMSDTIRGEYEPDSFTLQPAVHALAAVGIEFPDDDYLLTQRESCAVVPTKPTAAMLKAMAESRAVDDEGEFPAMLDLLDFSGENKTRTVLEAAYAAAIDAAIATGEKK